MLKRKVMVVYGKKAEYYKQVDSFLKGKIPPLIVKRKERSRMTMMNGNGVGEGNGSGHMFRTLVYITRNKATLMSNNSTGVNNNNDNNVLLEGNEGCDSARSATVKLNMVNAYKVKDKQCSSSRNSSRYNCNGYNKYKQRTCSMNIRKKFFQVHNKSKTESKQNDNNNEEKVNTFIKNEFKSVRLGIEEQVRESVFTLNKEINLNFSLFKPQLISPRCLPDKHRKLSKYVNLSNANKHQQHAIPLKLLNNTYNINTIRNNYSFIKKDTTTTTPRTNMHIHKTHICSDYKRNRWRLASYFVIKHLNNLKISSLSLIFNNPQLNLTPTFPFEHQHSKQCFLYVKSGNKPAFINIITRHRHLLLNFDASYQNIIHWIIKRNKYDYISFAGAKGACLNFRDFTGKTPLHYACTNGHIESVMVLLFEMANPFIVDNNNKTCEQYITQYTLTKYKHIIKMIKRAKALHLLHMNGSLRSYCDRIRKGLYFLYVYQLRLEFNFERYCMYDSVNGYYIHFDDEQWNKINEFIKLEEELYKKHQLLNIN